MNEGKTAKTMSEELLELKRRVEVLEAREAVSRFMYHWGYTADQVELTNSREKAEYLAHQLMTDDGVCDFSAIPGWMGVWGPKKEQIVENFLAFSQAIHWAYHIYPNAKIDVNLEENTAHYSTYAEFVPLVLNGTVQLMFLTQNSYLRRVGGEWKMVKYHLSELRLLDLRVPHP